MPIDHGNVLASGRPAGCVLTVLVDPSELLRQYNPMLVMLPQDLARPRPYKPWFSRSKEARGDYHPCSALFFLSQVRVRTGGAQPYLIGAESDRSPLGLNDLKALVANSDPNGTYDWEMDVASIRSQKPSKAWLAYKRMVEQSSGPFQATVHGRWVRYSDRIALQYFYLYVYNDAGNYHEGDWEMVTLELSADGTPLSAGYAGHHGGFKRKWERVSKKDGRPIVYVARGSHASYFEHKKDGHRTKSLAAPSGLPWLIDLIVRRTYRRGIELIKFLRWNDYTATHPDFPGDEPWNKGEFVSPSLAVLPSLDDVEPDGDRWWMRIQCRWGSRHGRLRGTAAPYPAWEQRERYDDPLGWLEDLDRGRST